MGSRKGLNPRHQMANSNERPNTNPSTYFEVDADEASGSENATNEGRGTSTMNSNGSGEIRLLIKFQSTDVQTFFRQAEATFLANNIADQRLKWRLVLDAMSDEHIARISSRLPTVMDQNPYETLKEVLIDTYSLSSLDLMILMKRLSLGDIRPTEYIDQMRKSMGGDNSRYSENILKWCLMFGLPMQTKKILAPFMEAKNADELAKIADGIMWINLQDERDHTHSPKITNNKASGITLESINKKIDDLEFTHQQQMKILWDEIERMKAMCAPAYANDYYPANKKRSGPLSQPRHSSYGYDHPGSNGGRKKEVHQNQTREQSYGESYTCDNACGNLCFYHFRFGTNARRCGGQSCPRFQGWKNFNGLAVSSKGYRPGKGY